MLETRRRYHAASTAFAIAVAAAMVFGLVSTSPNSLHAQPDSADEKKKEEAQAEASKRFQKGVELYQAGDIRAALIEFRRAYRIAPTFHLLFNIGQAAAELRDYVEAYQSFNRYLAEGGDKVAVDRRAMVNKEISRLEGYLARATIRVSVGDAEVSIDGELIGRSPLSKPVLLSAGRRRIVVTKEGFARWERNVDLAGEDDRTVEVELVSSTATGSSTTNQPLLPTNPGGQDQPSRLGTGFWVAGGATIVFGSATAIAALLTRRAERDFEAELEKVPNTSEAIDDAAKKVDRFALATDIGIGLTAVAAVTTIVFALRGSSESNEQPEAAAISVGVHPNGIAISGAF